jgi:uncharacterized protein YkwD
MRAVKSVKGRVAILVAVAAIGIGASACFPNVTPGVGPSDPLKAQIFNHMNYDRAVNGVPQLMYSPKLDNLAGTWAWNMATHYGFTHQNLTNVLYGPDFAGWYTLGENILVGPGNMTAGQMEAAWMKSAPHRANILNRSFNAVGVGYWRGPDGRLWICVDFGGI